MPCIRDVLICELNIHVKNIIVLRSFLWMKGFIELLPFELEGQLFFAKSQ
jgi:hypothetical protein